MRGCGADDKVTRCWGDKVKEFRFVVLHHTGVAEPHFDLMIEEAGREMLRAWRVFVPPAEWGDGDVGAVRIADHRAVYMTYEGELSGGRGEVKRVAEGRGEVVQADERGMRVRMREVEAGGHWEIILPLDVID